MHKFGSGPRRWRLATAWAILWLATFGTFASAPPVHAQGQVSAEIRSELIEYARHALGKPYVWGGASPEGFDCSGLVQYSYGRAGIRVPRTAAEQRAASKPLDVSRLKPGDLLFFDTTHRYSHVGIYLGKGRFIHAPSHGKTVSVSNLSNPYWQAALSYVGSFLN